MSSSGTHGAGGVGCCCFRCCTCIHVNFFKSLPGIIKICETVITVAYYLIWLFVKFEELWERFLKCIIYNKNIIKKYIIKI